jgi:hypothetical protein
MKKFNTNDPYLEIIYALYMKKLLYLIVLVSSINVTLADVCICTVSSRHGSEYGGAPVSEIFWHKMGCSIWNDRQKTCRIRTTMAIDEDLEGFLEQHHQDGEKVKIGYVGHWSSSNETVGYLNDEISPLVQKFNGDFYINNTACLSMKEPQKVKKAIDAIPRTQDQKIVFKGTQTVSIGIFDDITLHLKKADLWSRVSTEDNEISYPKCSAYRYKSCTGYQNFAVGTCLNHKDEKTKMTCVRRLKYNKKNNELRRGTGFSWMLKKNYDDLLKNDAAKEALLATPKQYREYRKKQRKAAKAK